MHPIIEVIPTARYTTLNVKDDHKPEMFSSTPYIISFPDTSLEEITRRYDQNGFCIYKNIFKQNQITSIKKNISKLVKKLISCYDYLEDEFSDFDKEVNNIVRMPRIGRGKHNIHFDPEFSEQHQVVFQAITEAGILELLSSVTGLVCSLRESGISITRPSTLSRNEMSSSDMSNGFSSGEGIEWHSDGAKGEFTMLMSYEDIEKERGCVRYVPGSHLEYVEGTGFDENLIKENLSSIEEKKIEYCYRAGEPVIFDARSLHSATNNFTEDWRVVMWFIMDCY
jgi:hypothetical protein